MIQLYQRIIDCTNMYNCINVNDRLDIFYANANSCIDQTIPKKIITINSNKRKYPVFFSND
nr:unnamed protein product [Callosobruchus chinensis]